jgi:hypothetical protein
MSGSDFTRFRGLGHLEKLGFLFNIKAAICGHAKNLTTGIWLMFKRIKF